MKAPVENIPIIEYIIENGCIVNYKTQKHQRTALQWAKLLNKTKIIQILELAIIVQYQANKIFYAISIGNNKYVINIIKDGEFFNYNNEYIFYNEMKKYIDLEYDIINNIKNIKNKINNLGNQTDIALLDLQKSNEIYYNKQKLLNKAFLIENEINKRISIEYTNFEKISLKLNSVNITEISNLKQPNLLLRLAAFSYCIIFNIINLNDYNNIINTCTIEITKKWYLYFLKEIIKPYEVVRKIQAFTLARIDMNRDENLIIRCKQLYEDMVDVLLSEKRKKSLFNNSSNSINNNSNNKIISEKEKKNELLSLKKNNSIAEMSILTVENSISEQPDRDKSAVVTIPDADWDSDADIEGDNLSSTGTWVKGEWVPITRKKKEWWKQENNNNINSNSSSRTTATVRTGASTERDSSYFHSAKSSSKFVYLSDEIISQSVKSRPRETVTLMSDLPTTIEEERLGATTTTTGIAGGSSNRDMMLPDTDLDETGLTAKEDDDNDSTSTTASNWSDRSSLNYSHSHNNSFNNSHNNSRSSSPQRSNTPNKSNKNRSKSSRQGAGLSLKGKKKSRKSLKVSSDPPPATTSTTAIIDISIEEYFASIDSETYDCYQFIITIFAMLKSILRYSIDSNTLYEAKIITSKCSQENEIAYEKTIELTENYQKEYKIRENLENSLIENMKKERFYKQRIHNFKEKVRVARLLNEISMNGHTAISWAASIGAYDIVEEMLTHGATVGFPISLLNLTASFLQYSYYIYKLTCSFYYSKKKEFDDENEDNTNINKLKPKIDNIQFIRELTILKEKREKIKNKLLFLRSKTRFPVPEAVYTGKWEIVHRIYERRLFHIHFSNTWIFPSAPFPYLRKLEQVYERRKISIKEVLTYGMNDNAAGKLNSFFNISLFYSF